VGELSFECLDAQPDRYAVTPILLFKLRIADTDGDAVDAIALRCQIRIEPQRRRYAIAEEDRLLDLFGGPARWGETVKPFQFATISHMVPGFAGSTTVDLPVPCTYDFEVASTKYFQALEDGEIPLLLLFSGSVFSRGENGIVVHQVPWDREAAYRLPVAVWRALMDLNFPNSAWIRLNRGTLDALQRFKAVQALPTWDRALEVLLAGKTGPGA
jgi:Family of unknown function (DUF6084)